MNNVFCWILHAFEKQTRSIIREFLKVSLNVTEFSNISGKNSFYRIAGMQRHSTDFAAPTTSPPVSTSLKKYLSVFLLN